METLTTDVKGWSWNQANLRHELGIMRTQIWEEYEKQWREKNGNPGFSKGTLPITRYVRRKPGDYK